MKVLVERAWDHAVTPSHEAHRLEGPCTGNRGQASTLYLAPHWSHEVWHAGPRDRGCCPAHG